MVDYDFYTNIYKGNSIPAADFPRLLRNATAQLNKYKRIYTVTGNEQDEGMAVSSMADALYYFEQAASGGLAVSVSVGSVSSSSANTLPDTSPAAQATELYRCATTYLTIYRGG